MKTKVLSILLALLAASLGFNAFCLYGYSKAKERRELAHSPQGRMELLAKELNLTEEQYERFQQRRQSMGGKRQAFLDELIKDKPKQKLLESFALDVLALLQEFMRDLSPEQKQKFVEIINKRFSPSRQTSTAPAE